ncbi:MAG: hypothetical protein DBX47_05105 [Clostridiales bacterium]|nr:MAG: hypothetical protein DBX47_05105 [Clostridiales bacterium]
MFKKLLPHITTAISLMFIVLLIIDMFINDAMAFINNDIFKWLCLIFCVLVIIVSGALMYYQHKK